MKIASPGYYCGLLLGFDLQFYRRAEILIACCRSAAILATELGILYDCLVLLWFIQMKALIHQVAEMIFMSGIFTVGIVLNFFFCHVTLSLCQFCGKTACRNSEVGIKRTRKSEVGKNDRVHLIFSTARHVHLLAFHRTKPPL